MMKKKNQIIGLMTAMAMTMTMFAGCGASKTADKSTDEISDEQVASTDGAEETASEEFSYPMSGEHNLTYWCELNQNVSANYTNLGETAFGKGLQEKTGVTIEFLHPAANQGEEQFNLMLADGDLPDVMEYHWRSYSGGPEKAIADGNIIPLNDIIDKYCPNFKAYLAEHPEVDRQCKTDEGTYYVFPFVRGADTLRVTMGLWIRQDWLDELGLQMPTTIDEWHDVLVAFKEQKNAITPFTYEFTMGSLTENLPFMFAFDASRSFCLGDDGKVHYGASEESYKEYLSLMHQWYEEGILDPDIATQQMDQVSAKMTSGMAGASMGWAGSRAGVWTKAALETDPNYNLQPAPVPKKDADSVVKKGQLENLVPDQGGVAITTSCKDVEAAARLLDWAYGEEGHIYYNFGTEGESFTFENGNPVYTSDILDNPDGLPVAQAMSAYIRGNYNGPFVQDERYISQYYVYDGQKNSNATWLVPTAGNYVLPPVTPTTEESEEFSAIMNEINTYRDEMTLKYILGTESLDNFATFVDTLNSMGLPRAIEIQNAALERYKNR